MNNDVQIYIKTICNHIKWKNYHSPIKAELHNHINDSISEFMKQDMTEEEALDLTLKKIGNPDMIGAQLNEAYKPEYNKILITVVFFSITIFSLLEYFTILEITGDYLYLVKVLLRILLGSLGASLLFSNDWSSGIKLNKFTSKVFISIALICIILNFIPFSNKANIISGMLLLFPSLCCCYMDRVKGKKVIGLILMIAMFIMPIFISYYINSFASMMLLSLNAWIVLLVTIKSTWLDFNKKSFLYVFASLPFVCILIFSIFKKLDNILLNIEGFFVFDIIKKSILFGRDNSNFLNIEQVIDYPITFMVADYGYIILVAYLLFFSIIIFEIIKIYNRQKNFLAKLIIISVLVSFVTEFGFSLLLNLGIPLAKGITVPFLDLNFGIVIKIIQLGLVVKLDCFGNYIFSNFSNNKLFDVEGGKIIIYYK